MKLVQIPSFMSIGTTDIELREFKEKKKKKKMDKMRKIIKFMFSSNKKRKWYFSEIFHTQFCFDIFYAVKSSKVKLT